MTHEIAQRVPGRWDMTLFQAKAAVFRARRLALELFTRAPRKYARGHALEGSTILAEAISPLAHTLTGNRDAALTAGKIQNLRIATRAIDGIEIPAGGVFSFWRQIGPLHARPRLCPGPGVARGLHHRQCRRRPISRVRILPQNYRRIRGRYR